MRYRRLGRTGLAVSPICLGTMGFGPPADKRQIDSLVHAILDMGVNLIDTANCYDGPQRGEIIHGYAEEMIGKSLGSRRDDVVLVTKAGVPLRPGPQHRGLSATHLLRELEASLRRLRTDRVDVFMLHWPDPFAHVEEVLRCVDTAIRQGKAHYFAISNHQGWQVCEYLWEADKRDLAKPCVSEIPLSLLERRYENDLPFYQKHEVGVLAYQPLKGGLLRGGFASNKTASGPRADQSPQRIAGWDNQPDERVRRQIDQLKNLARDAGVELAHLALAWILARPAVSSIILGARSATQMADALKAVDLHLRPEHVAGIDQIAPGPPSPVPRFER